MKGGTAIIIVGIIMFVSGLVTFYYIQNIPELDPLVRTVKHGGTFVGLMGIGVITAGILLYLINRSDSSFQENMDKEFKQ